MFGKLRPSEVLKAPYIKVDVVVSHSIKDTRKETNYVIAPSGKKIATYIVNQIFGSDLVTQTEGLQINWLMPTLKEALELGIYQTESFIYIHKFDNKIYLECIKKSDIHNIVQKFDKVMKATIEQEFEGLDGEKYLLKRIIELKDGNSYIEMKAFQITKNGELLSIQIGAFNKLTGNEYSSKYILPYEVLINIDLGQDFFKDSGKLLNEEMNVINVMADEIEKTRTRIATTQHYQSGDIYTQWQPSSSHYKVDTLSVGSLQDYFTLLPGDRDHAIFEFLQGNIRVQEYMTTFKFYDQQIIQMAGLSPASFGYEKDAYMNETNVDLSKNASDMTIEAIKSQIEPQINKLLENIVKAQKSQNIQINVIPSELSWDYGNNEKFDDMKKLQVLSRINGVASVPYSYRAKIIAPILKKMIDDGQDIEDLLLEHQKEEDNIKIDFGEV